VEVNVSSGAKAQISLRSNGTAGSRALPRTLPPEENQCLCGDTSARVKNYILPASGAGRDKALVPLVEAGYECRAQNGDAGPAQRPLYIGHGGQGGTPGAEKQNA